MGHWVTRILPTQASKPPGWVGIDCNACRGYIKSPYQKVRYHCKYGCQPNGLKPPFFTKVASRPPTPAATAPTQRKTSTETVTKQSQNTKIKIQTTSITRTIQRPSKSMVFTEDTTFKRESIVDSGTNHLSFLWILCGILAACIILIGSVVLFTTIWKRLNVGVNNKIGISDVIIHNPTNPKKATLYVIM